MSITWRERGFSALVAGIILALLMCGCTPPSQSSVLSDADTRHISDQLNAALADKGSDLATLFSDEQADWTLTNLRNLAAVTFDVLGAGRLSASWKPGASDQAAWHEVAVDGRCSERSCTSITMRPVESEPAPIWLATPIDVVTLGDLTLVGQNLDQWIGAGQQGIQTSSEVAQTLRQGWSGRLVIQVVPSQPAFHAVTGSTDLDDEWAITWRQDFAVPGAEAGMAIVVNDVLRLGRSSTQRGFLIAHESVHAATGGLGSPVKNRKWVSEGLAESMALASFPDMAAASAYLLRQHCDLTDPPSDEELLSSDANTRELAYARAAMAVRLIGDETLIRQLWVDPQADVPASALLNDAC